MTRRIKRIGFSVAAALAAACVTLFVVFGSVQDQRAMAAEFLARAALQASSLESVHLKCRMRTLPNDNFSLVGPAYDFVEIDVWKQLGNPEKYRLEKPGRVLVCDGQSTIMLIQPSHCAVKGPAGADFDAAWLRDLTDIEKILTQRLRESVVRESNVSLKDENVEGKPKRIVTVDVTANNPPDDYLRNKLLDTSDTRSVFQFDVATKRLEEMQILLRDREQDVLIFEVTGIEYNPQLPASAFALELPADVTWYEEPKVLPDNARYASLSPKEAATAFFDACANEDWDEVQKYWATGINNRFKKGLGGLKVISIGEPFQASWGYPGWFVPYEITFKSGQTKKHNLAVRNDNPAKRWVVDGGL
ncbi:MAG TPA: hypothetical protein VMV94_07790 [Phycisphaerae bacterium]|nr:hypothetical protein [Phycisphaerae bacterium]